MWYIGCEYRCMVSECDSVVFDMPDMMIHIRTVHEMTPR
jgi:predicted small metal-binding protein